MEGFLHNLDLHGSVPECVAVLTKAGFHSPEDLLFQEPSIADLSALGINYGDAKRIFVGINPDLENTLLLDDVADVGMMASPMNFDLDIDIEPITFDLADHTYPAEEEEEYLRLKREYEALMGGGSKTDPDPTPATDPEEDEYERAKAEYLKLMNGQNPEPEPVPEPAPTNPAPEEDDYEKMKAEYERMAQAAFNPATAEPETLEVPVTIVETPADPELDEYEKAKAQYESMLKRQNSVPSVPGVSRVAPEPALHITPLPRSTNSLSSAPKSPDSSESRRNRPALGTRTGLTQSDNGSQSRVTASLAGGRGVTVSTKQPTRASSVSTGCTPRDRATSPNPTAKKPSPVSPLNLSSAASPAPTLNTVPIQGAGITGVTLVRDDAAQSQLEALKALAATGKLGDFGNELEIEVREPGSDLLFNVRLTTNMRQFSHLTFHRLDLMRRYSDFEELYKKLVSFGDYVNVFPKFPKKKDKSNYGMFNQMMSIIAKDPELNSLSAVVEFFDNTKCGANAMKTPRGSSTPRLSTPRSGSWFKK